MTTLTRTIRRNTFFSFLSSSTRLLSNAILFILVARFYGPEAFGQFTTAHTLATIFILVADFGFDLLLTTEIAQRQHSTNELLPKMLGVKMAFAFLASAVMSLIPLFQEMSPEAGQLTRIFSLYVLFSALLNFLFALFKGHEDLQHEAIISLTMNAGLLVALVVLEMLGAHLSLVASVFVASRVLGLLMAAVRSRRFTNTIVPVWDMHWLRTVWKQVTLFGVYFLFGNLFFLLDTILLSFLKGDREVGIYQSVFRLVAVALVVPEIMVNTLLPTLTRFYGTDRARWEALGSIASKILYHMGMLFGLVMVVAADLIVGLVYGFAKYREAIPILQVFGAVLVVRYTFEIPALMLTTSNRHHIRTALVVCATLFNALVNAFVIPRYGAFGAAWVSLVTNCLVGIGYILGIRNIFAEKWFSPMRLMPLIAILIAGLLFVQFPGVSVWVRLAAVVFAYVPLTYMVGYTSNEKRIALSIATGFER